MPFNNGSTRPPPPTGAMPAYAFARYYRHSLRPLVICVGVASAIWAAVWGISAFQDISVDNGHVKNLVPFDIVLGTLYMSVLVIEIFGVFAAFRQSIPLVRSYSFLSLVVAIIVAAAEILRIVIHFKFKNDIISECTTLAQTDDDSTDIGFFGSHHANGLSPTDAAEYCNNAWSRDSFSDIAWLLVGLVLTLLFSSIAFSFYRQLLDPSIHVTRPSARNQNPYAQDNVPLQTFRPTYNPPPGAPPVQREADRDSMYAPPYEEGKLPGYGAGIGASEVGDVKKDISNEEKDLAGVNH